MIQGIVTNYQTQAGESARGAYVRHSVTVDGKTYSCFGNKDVKNANPGDRVEFEEKDDGKYLNFDPKTFKVLERGAVKVQPKPTKDDQIMRQNAMAHATAIAIATSGKTTTDIDMAKRAIQIAETFIFQYTKEGIIPQ